MWQFISMRSFVVLGASTIAIIVYRRCNPKRAPRVAKTHDVMCNQIYSRSCATNAFTPSTYHQDWTAWQLHTSITTYINTAHQLTIEQQRRLLFVRWLVREGKLTEWITDTADIDV